METALDQISHWAGWLVKERWPEILVIVATLSVWRWWMGHKLRNRITTLETKQNTPPVSPAVNGCNVTVEGGIHLTHNYYDKGSGRYRLGLESPAPIRLAGVPVYETGDSATLTVTKADSSLDRLGARWLASPGAGRLAAELICKAPDLGSAREIWEAFRGRKHRTEIRWAYWAFSRRLHEAGEQFDASHLAEALILADEKIDPDEELEATIERWSSER